MSSHQQLASSYIVIYTVYLQSFQERVRFHNTGPSAVPGVIVMSIADGGCEGAPAALTQLDPL